MELSEVSNLIDFDVSLRDDRDQSLGKLIQEAA